MVQWNIKIHISCRVVFHFLRSSDGNPGIVNVTELAERGERRCSKVGTITNSGNDVLARLNGATCALEASAAAHKNIVQFRRIQI